MGNVVGRSLNEGVSRLSPVETEEEHVETSVKVPNIPYVFRTWYCQNMSVRYYRHTGLFSPCLLH